MKVKDMEESFVLFLKFVDSIKNGIKIKMGTIITKK